MSKARTLANLISDNSELADGQISVAEVVGAAPTANPTFTGNIDAGDNVKIRLGNSDDLQLYHDGSNSYITGKPDGVGAVVVKAASNSGGVLITNRDGDNIFSTQSNSAHLHYDGSSKLATTSTGIDVTGTLTATKLASANGVLELDDDGSHNGIINSPASMRINIDSNNNGTGESFVVGHNQTSIDSNNTLLKVQEDGNVGIGTSSPSAPLDVRRSDGSGVVAEFHNNVGYGLKFTVQGDGGVNTINSESNQALAFATNGTSERMRIDSSGHFYLGKTSTSSAVAGIFMQSNGGIDATRSGARVLTLNRLSSDGSIIEFQKANSTVGSIGSVSSRLHIENGDTGLRIAGDLDQIFPCGSGGGDRDAAIDLGSTGVRFKDIHLSGGVYLGGTGTANKLEDYEEGTWQPTFKQGVSVNSYAIQSGFYTKIGRVVHCEFYIQSTGSGATAVLQVQGLPFTSSSTTYARGGGTSSFQDMSFSSTFQFYGSNNVNHFSCYYSGSAEVTFGGSYTNKYLIGTYTYITDA